MNVQNHKNLDKDNLGAVAERLWRLQDELDNLESKLGRTVQNLESLLDEDKEPDVKNETVCKKTNDSNQTLEETLHHRRPTVETKVIDENVSMLNYTVRVNDINILEDKTGNNFSTKTNTWKTCDYWSLQNWQRTNCYILRGYRPPLPSVQVCLLSIFRIHTETVNIWSHLLGCVLFVALFLHASLSSLPLEDKLVLSPFFVGAILCLGFSSTFHTLHCHSQTASWLVSRLDYCGIVLLIAGSFVPWIHYVFFCDTKVKTVYLAGVLTLAICSTVVSFSQTFNHPLYRTLRATVFTGFGLCGVVPSLHFILIYGLNAFFVIGTPLVLTAIFYILGTVIYAVRIPERIFPGKFDIFFQSHQVFHVLVLLATVIDYIGIVRIGALVQYGRNDPDFCQQKHIYFDKPHEKILHF